MQLFLNFKDIGTYIVTFQLRMLDTCSNIQTAIVEFQLTSEELICTLFKNVQNFSDQTL